MPASSAYVMQKAFDSSKELQAFKNQVDLAPAILERVDSLTRQPSNPVVLSAYLYALELTGAEPQIRSATRQVLGNSLLRSDPLVGQFAGQIGFNLIRTERELTPSDYLTSEELERVLKTLEQEEGQP
ncbi:MAG UNVERIFIED_CONTAM: hypothetical protein LVR29_27735 [Microcystis novacekii LVE1205-3]|jgi:hypothetical protein